MINGSKPNTGFIAVHRTIQNHWIWEDPIKLKWWLDILMTVNHANVKVNIGFELMDCKRGQSLNSLQTWAKRWRVDVSTVRRFFKLLQDDKMILTENVRKTTRLTVCNYDTYNNSKQGKQLQNNLETIQMQFQDNTNNNVLNNENNENNGKQINIAFDHFWNLYNKKSGKEKCIKLWSALMDEERQKVIDHLPAYIISTPDKQYRKNPEGYLRNKSFNDEIIINGKNGHNHQIGNVPAGDRAGF